MKIIANIYKNHKIIKSASAASDISPASAALLDCLEHVYKELDLAEPVWISKHERDLAYFGRVRFMPADFIEPVKFNYFEIEIVDEDE